MYAFISGNVVSVGENMMVLENNGIGYALCVSDATIRKVGEIGSKVQLHTYLQVREDALTLFGFYSLEEKGFFEKLISISGIGPKLALQVLSGFDLNTLLTAVVCGDVKKLSQIKGVGKRTAERIVLELKNQLGEAMTEGGGSVLDGDGTLGASSIAADAVFALTSLGISKSDAVQAVNAASKDAKTVEELITLALRRMN